MVDLTKLSKQDLLMELAALHDREQALRQHQRRLQAVIDSAPILLREAGLDKKCFDFNKKWLEFTGRTLEQEIGFGWAEGIHPNDVERCLEIYTSAFDARIPFEMEYRLRRHDGVYRYMLDYGAPQYSDTGELIGYIGSCMDVTEQVQARQSLRTAKETLEQRVLARTDELHRTNEQLRASQSLLDGVLSSSLDGISVLQAIRNEQGQIVDFEWLLVNPRAETIIGRSAEQLIGKRVLVELGPIKLFEAYARVVETGEPLHTEAFFELGKSPGWIDVVAVKLDDGVAVTFRDVTRQREAQQAIQQLNDALSLHAHKLATANRELHEFSYSISHDLRAPLRAINGFAQIISRRYRTGLNEEAHHYLDNILEAGSRMERLIDDLLIYSRLGRPTAHLEPVDLRPLLAGAAETFAAQIHELKAALSLPDKTVRVLADRSLLERVFVNLFDNALKYHQPDIPPNLEVTIQTEKSMAIIGVRDNGIGIPREYQEEIFDVFYRLHPPEAYPGTGIGLAIIRKSIQLMQGEISVESTPGKGTVFYVKLPLAPEKRYN